MFCKQSWKLLFLFARFHWMSLWWCSSNPLLHAWYLVDNNRYRSSWDIYKNQSFKPKPDYDMQERVPIIHACLYLGTCSAESRQPRTQETSLKLQKTMHPAASYLFSFELSSTICPWAISCDRRIWSTGTNGSSLPLPISLKLHTWRCVCTCGCNCIYERFEVACLYAQTS